MNKEEAQDLLKRYRMGQCTERELEIINNWYQSFDEIKADLSDEDKLKRVKQEIFAGITDTIGREEKSKKKSTKTKRFHLLSFQSLSRIAAVLLIGGVLGFLFFKQNKKVKEISKPIAENSSTVKEALPAVIYLSDGSKVTLKEGSRLDYPATFTGNTREVSLVGEAFFEVAKNKEKPFIIHSANLTTKVLGTSFNIKAYENDESAEVAVVTGRVSVSVNQNSKKEKEEVVLMPNQKAVYFKEKGSLVQQEVKHQEFTQTDKKARLVFNETPLGEIVKVMNANYKVNIKLENEEMKNCLITAELTNEPVEISLMIITKAIGAEYEVKGNEILLKGNGCRQTE